MLVYLEKQQICNRFCIYLNKVFITGIHLSYYIINVKEDNKKIKKLIDNKEIYEYLSFQELEELLKNKN